MSTSRNIVLTIARQTLGIGLRLGSTVLVARALGPTNNGRYAIALLVPALLTGALNLGIPAANAHYIARGTLGFTKACHMSFKLWLGLITIGSLACLCAHASGAWRIDVSIDALLLAAAIFPATLGSSFAAGLLQGVGAFGHYNRGLLIAPLCAAIAMIGLAFARALDITHALLAQLTAELFSLGYLVWSVEVQSRTRGNEQAHAAAPSLRALLGFAGLTHLSPLLMLLNYRTDIVMLEWLVGPAAVGVYTVAARIAEQLWTVSQAMSSVLLPALSTSGTHDRGHASGAQATLISHATLSALWASGALAVMAMAVHPLLLAIFGPSYRAAAVPLLYLLPGAALLGGARVAAVAMTALGRPQRNVLMALAVLACNVPLNLLLVPRYRENGAALATSLSYAVGWAVALGLLRPLTGAPLKAFLVPTTAELARAKRTLLGLRSRS